MFANMKLKTIIAALMLTGLMPTAWAQQDPVTYFYHEWVLDPITGKNRVTNESGKCTAYKVLNSSTHTNEGDFGVGDNPEWDGGGYKWVVVEGNVTLRTLHVIGEGHLILKDGATLTCTGGVWLEGDNSLSIYSQSSGDAEGKLIVTNSNKYCAAIGCWDQAEEDGSPTGMGTLNIYGGDITATAGAKAAGIGGGRDRGMKHNLTIFGGKVTATGGEHGAGIGGGYGGGQGGLVTIYGGKVNATGGIYAAGIGGGETFLGGGEGGVVAIHGGDVTATAGKSRTSGDDIYCSAIGNGANGNSSGSFLMTGGTLHANSADGMAIHSPDIRISGGELIARSGSNAIRCTSNYMEISGGTVDAESTYGSAIKILQGQLNIMGGNVRAIGGGIGAGITGYNVDNIKLTKYCFINIYGGTVYAKGGNKGGAGIGNIAGCISTTQLTITDGTVTAIGQGGGAGIGGGACEVDDASQYKKPKKKIARLTPSPLDAQKAAAMIEPVVSNDNSGHGLNVIIRGGTVMAQADGNACAIGSGITEEGHSNTSKGRLELNGNLSVKSGTSESDLALVAAANRVNACRGEGMYIKIEACDHSAAASYTYQDEDKHMTHCAYCSQEEEKNHNYTDGQCACGKVFDVVSDTWTVTLYQATDDKATAYDGGTEYKVVKGETFTIPENKDIANLTFMDWLKDPDTAPMGCEMKDAELPQLTPAGYSLTPTADVALYARYRCQYDAKWTWDYDEHGNHTATVTVTWLNGDEAVENLTATVYDNTEEPTADAPEGKYKYSATASYTKAEGVEYQFTDHIEMPYIWNISLSDDSDNSTTLSDNVGRLLKSVTLTGRTLYKDGSWNTLCLPFDTSIDDSPLDGDGVVAQMIDTEQSQLDYDGHLTVTFKKAPATIEAGTPFIIKWTSGSDLVSPVFTDVVISTTAPKAVHFPGGFFEGQFSPFAITSDNKAEIILLSANNTLGYSNVARTLRPFRAHFVAEKESGSGGAEIRAMKSFDLFFDSEETTAIEGIGEQTLATGSQTLTDGDHAAYDLQGRKVSTTSLQPGLYIIGGKKVHIHK